MGPRGGPRRGAPSCAAATAHCRPEQRPPCGVVVWVFIDAVARRLAFSYRCVLLPGWQCSAATAVLDSGAALRRASWRCCARLGLREYELSDHASHARTAGVVGPIAGRAKAVLSASAKA